MAAPIGNKFWELRARHGREKLFSSPEALWEAAVDFFTWYEENPLYETKGFAFQGEVTRETFPKMRAMTMSGFCLYLGVSESYFRAFKVEQKGKSEDFLTVLKAIETAIYNQKFQGAAAELLNANIISRELGLRDNVGISDGEGNPLKVPTMIIVQPGDNSEIEIKEQE